MFSEAGGAGKPATPSANPEDRMAAVFSALLKI
jgi:hypothetical protein